MDIRNKAAILQAGYIPWLGFFEQMYRCDIFVFLDDVKYTKLDWRNRNRIKSPTGIHWLTIPVLTKGLDGQKICEAKIDNSKKWQLKHMRILENCYRRSKHFNTYFEDIKYFFTRAYSYLSPFTVDLTLWINEKLGLHRKILSSSDLNVEYNSKQDRLLNLLQVLDSNYFYEGKSGEDYIDTELFDQNGITVEFQDYDHPFYNQVWEKEWGFVSHLSVLDLLFNHGPESLDILTKKTVIWNTSGLSIRRADEILSGDGKS